jgi:thiol:disulfide interchange protein
MFKKLLAFPLFATTIWLLCVLGQQRGITEMAASLLLLLLAAFGFLVFDIISPNSTFKRILKALTFCAIAAVIIIPAVFLYTCADCASNNKDDAQSTARASNLWQPYSDEKLQALLNENHAVFVDFTAAWCVTCQVNKKVALETDTVQDFFKKKGIVTLQADWTNDDPKITAALEKLGRDSVPTNVLYIPGKEPILFPSVLTPGIVQNTVNSYLK